MLSYGDVKSVAIANLTTVGDLVAAPAASSGRRIVVLGWALSLDAAGELYVATRNADADGDDKLTGDIELAADTPLVVPPQLFPVLSCLPERALRFAATTAANGVLWYAIADL